MKKVIFIIAIIGLVFSVSSCENKKKKAEDSKSEEVVAEVVAINTLSKAEKDDGWMLLFDGTTSEGWRGYKKDHFPSGWKIVDGSIMCEGSGRGEAGSKEGGDIIYDKIFKNFSKLIELSK